MTATTAIEKWIIYRDGYRVKMAKPDDFTVPMGPETIDLADPDPNAYAHARVEEALGSLCKLRSQRETLTQLVVHVHAKGLPVKSFNGANFAWNHEQILRDTLDAIYGAIDERLKVVPMPQWAKETEERA